MFNLFNNNCAWSHDWDKWEQYLWRGETYLYGSTVAIETSVERQKRKCKRCGLVQDREVNRY